MINLYGLTILDGVRLAAPLVFAAICFALITWLMCYITEVRVNRKWLRDPANMERTVQDHLARKDRVIEELRKERDELKKENEQQAVIIRGVQNRVRAE